MRRTLLVVAALILLMLAPAVLRTSHIRFLTELYYLGIFAIGFNLLFGYAGMLNFGLNAGFALGAYGAGLATLHLPGAGGLAAMAIGLLAGLIGGVLMGLITVRLRGGYFALLTLGFAQFFLAIALKWRSVTRGDDGLLLPDRFLLPGKVISLADAANCYWLTLLIATLLIGSTWWMLQSPFGNAIVLVRENEERAQFIGYNTYLIKLVVFALANALAAAAGTCYAMLQTVVSPELFDIPLSGDITIMTILGGTGSFLGPLLGVGVYHILQDWLSQVTTRWQLFMGLLLVLLVMFAPRGITGLLKTLSAQPLIARWGKASASPAPMVTRVPL